MHGQKNIKICNINLFWILLKRDRQIYTHVDCVWNVMAHAQKPYFFFPRNGRFRLNRRGGASVQSTTDSRGVRISGSNVGYAMFRGSVKGTGYTLHSPVSPFTSPSRASPRTITFQLDSTLSFMSVTNTGLFIMYSGTTKIYYRNTVGHVFIETCTDRRNNSKMFSPVSYFSS